MTLREIVYAAIRGEREIRPDEVGYVANGSFRVNDVQAMIHFAKEQRGRYFPIMGQKLEEFVLGQKVKPIYIGDMSEVNQEIDDTLKSQMGDNGIVLNAYIKINDGIPLVIHQIFWGLVAYYVAFRERKETAKGRKRAKLH